MIDGKYTELEDRLRARIRAYYMEAKTPEQRIRRKEALYANLYGGTGFFSPEAVGVPAETEKE